MVKQADLIRTTLALRYASVLVKAQLHPAARAAVALEADRFGDPPASTIALTNHLITEAESFLAGRNAAADLTAWRDVVVLYIGDTPAARAASEDDTRNWVRGQLNELAEKRADLRLERAKNRNLGHRLRVAARMLVDDEDGLEDHIRRAVDELDRDEHEAMQSRVGGVLVDAELLDPIVDAALTRAGEAVPRG